MDNNQHVEDIVKCSDCGSRSLTRDETRGEVVCDDCGLVLEDNVIDQGAEWRVFSPEQGDQRARTGAPMTVMLHDKGLSTDIDCMLVVDKIPPRIDNENGLCEINSMK